MNKFPKKDSSPITIFLTITLALSSIFYFLIIYSGTLGGGNGLYIMGLMWCPGISALITLKLLKRNNSDLGWGWGKAKYQVSSFFIPFFYAFIAYLFIWIFGFGGFYNKEFVNGLSDSFGLGAIGNWLTIILYVLLVGVFGTISGMARALGEEIGWRGFLVPELYKKYGFTKTSLISGFIWGIWHLPILLFADYNSGTPSWYALSCFMVLIVSMGFVYAWYRLKSGNLWTAVILHASHNLFIQRVFTPLTLDTGNTSYYKGEFGIVLPIIGIVFSLYFWKKRSKLKKNFSFEK